MRSPSQKKEGGGRLSLPLILSPKEARAAGITQPVTHILPVSEWAQHRAVLQDFAASSIPACLVAEKGNVENGSALVAVWRQRREFVQRAHVFEGDRGSGHAGPTVTTGMSRSAVNQRLRKRRERINH